MVGRWFIFLEEEVARQHAGKPQNGDQDDIANAEGEDEGPKELDSGEHGPDEVESSVGLVGVLREVDGEVVVDVGVVVSHIKRNRILSTNKYMTYSNGMTCFKG